MPQKRLRHQLSPSAQVQPLVHLMHYTLNVFTFLDLPRADVRRGERGHHAFGYSDPYYKQRSATLASEPPTNQFGQQNKIKLEKNEENITQRALKHANYP
jgi:hypothetical protein